MHRWVRQPRGINPLLLRFLYFGMRSGQNFVREFLEIEGERDDNISSDGHRNSDNGALVEFWELDLWPTSYGAIHGGDLEAKMVGNED